jgi:hypothetical protein
MVFFGLDSHEMDQNANYVSFSPGENWLLVGLKGGTPGEVDFRLYNLQTMHS